MSQEENDPQSQVSSIEMEESKFFYMEISSNGTCCTEDPSSSDVWFYAISPQDQMILSLNNSLLKEKVTGKMAATTLKCTVTGDLHIQANELRAPYMEIPRTTASPLNTTEVSALMSM